MLALAGGIASAQAPVVDGTLSPGEYGPALWVNTNNTQFGDNTAGSSTGGATALGDPAAVTTGVEISIPFAAIGYVPGNAIRLMAVITGGDSGFFSNQWLPGRPLNQGNEAEARELDLRQADFAGDQFASVTPALVSGIVVDGQLDAAYGPAVALQTNFTGFGNAAQGNVDQAFGSELDGLYVVADTTAGVLHVMITGNVESNFNRLQLFIDSQAGGQQFLAQGNSGFIGRMSGLPAAGDNFVGIPGMILDNGFAADFVYSINGGDIGGGDFEFFTDLADLTTTPGSASFLGQGNYGATPAQLGNGTLIAINNSNTAGVGGDRVGAFETRPSPDFAVGSEMNAVYATVEGDDLFVLVTGNLGAPNNLVFFFDAQPGGQNRLRARNDAINFPGFAGNVDIDFGGLTRMGDSAPDQTNGLTFDAGFEADYFFSYSFDSGGTPVRPGVQAAVLRSTGRLETSNGNALDYGAFEVGRRGAPGPAGNPSVFNGPRYDLQDDTRFDLFTNLAPRAAADNLSSVTLLPIDPGTGLVNLLESTLDNSNVAGINGDNSVVADESAALAVTTGTEARFNLAELGWDGVSPIRATIFVVNGGYDFLSNQVSGSLPDLSGNLGDPRGVNFANIAGDQFVQLFPPPGPAGCTVADVADFLGLTVVDGSGPDGIL
ncbi:MAG: hypothetical protein C0468_03145, partial [Planctomyces sp.]|nr:hypothetical protein [Planctomyces sp.]